MTLLARKAVAELVGTAFLVAAVIGSGVMAIVATVGLVLVIFGSVRVGRVETVAFTVGGYIAAAYWFTSSTSFANPAVTIARMFSDTFAGIEPASVPVFVLMQLLGGALALGLLRLLHPPVPTAVREEVSHG